MCFDRHKVARAGAPGMRAGATLRGGLALACGLWLMAGCEPAPLPSDETSPPVPSAPAPAPACLANNDGVIEASEMPFVPGVVARYRILQDAEGVVLEDIDLEGFVNEQGVRVWDWSRPSPEGLPLAALQARALEDTWFAPHFPAAGLAGPLQADAALYGPLRIDETGVWLLGAASAEASPASGQTLLVYDEPVLLYPFPLAPGARAETLGRVRDGRLFGLPTALDDRYEVEVTGIGTLILPHLVLENTLRVTLRLERTLLVGDARQVTHVFLHECLGEVARARSAAVPLASALGDDFSLASEVWRLSL